MQPPTHEDKKLDKYLISIKDKPLSEKEYELGGLIDHATGGYGNITKKQRWERAKIKALHNLILSEVESYAKSNARADERQKCIEELNGIDGKTEDEMVMFMGHILERIRKREEGRAKLSGGSKELPPRELIWEGITYYKEQAIAKFSERVD